MVSEPAAQSVTQPTPTATNTIDKTSLIQSPTVAGRTPPPPVHFAETWIPLERWCNVTGQALPERLPSKPSGTYALHAANGTFVMRAGSQSAQWEGTELRMGFTPQVINSQVFVHRLDLQKTIEPLIAKPADPKNQSPPNEQGVASSEGERAEVRAPQSTDPVIHQSTNPSITPVLHHSITPTLNPSADYEGSQSNNPSIHQSTNPAFRPSIVIDPGHGGQDGGAISVLGNKLEKEFTLDWARRLGTLMQSNGWQVFLTRTNDAEVSLSNRVLFSQEKKADLFVSLHFNSAGTNENEGGLETYCLTPSGMPSTVTRGFPDQPSLAFPNNQFDADNLRLAAIVHKELLAVNGHHDRSVRRARFLGVLRGQQRPAILIEGGYLTNRREAAMIARADYRQKLAEAVAEGLQKRIKAKVRDAGLGQRSS